MNLNDWIFLDSVSLLFIKLKTFMIKRTRRIQKSFKECRTEVLFVSALH
jgi:hypothetical protein